jgi:hypothetical protein
MTQVDASRSGGGNPTAFAPASAKGRSDFMSEARPASQGARSGCVPGGLHPLCSLSARQQALVDFLKFRATLQAWRTVAGW